jgi:hypothetical protein
MENRRTVINRVPKEQLPKNLQSFFVYVNGNKIKAETLDVSRTGMSIMLPLDSNEIVDYQMKLENIDGTLKFQEEIVYVRQMDGGCRVSLMFNKKNRTALESRIPEFATQD